MTVKERREAVYKKYNGRCAYCGKAIGMKQMQVDHIFPKRNFARHFPNLEVDAMDNLNPSCATCNRRKDTFTIEDFREQIWLQTERLNKYSSQYRLALTYGLIHETLLPVTFYFEKYPRAH